MRKIQRTISPIDGSVYVEREQATTEQIDSALIQSHKAQLRWRQIPLAERQAICRSAVERFVEQKQAIAEDISWQMGRPIRYAPSEVDGFAERANYMIAAAGQALAPIQLPQKAGFTRSIHREPLGTLLVIAPWNYPLLTAINSIMPALLAGNGVLLKHSAQTPLCAEHLVRAFKAAGLPEGLFQYLHMCHQNTEYAIRHKLVQQLAFTGSVQAGSAVERAAAGRFIGVGLELGGKDPAYVRADAALDYAVDTIIDGAFFNSGQSCCAIERIYVHSDLYHSFVAKAVARIEQYRLGRADDPQVTLGPVVSARAADFVRNQIDEAISQGAKMHIDPSLFPVSEPGTPYLAPQLLTDVDHTMRVMREETFGPLAAVQRVSADSEAIALMNDSEFGLTASIFTGDIAAATALGEQLQVGTFFINRCDYLDPALAWSGVKNSGRGCTLSTLGFDALTRPKSFHIKHKQQ